MRLDENSVKNEIKNKYITLFTSIRRLQTNGKTEVGQILGEKCAFNYLDYDTNAESTPHVMLA